MGTYTIEIRYGDSEPPLRIRLPECTPDEAETKRQELVTEIDHAIQMGTPRIPVQAVDADLDAELTIDPSRVTDVALRE